VCGSADAIKKGGGEGSYQGKKRTMLTNRGTAVRFGDPASNLTWNVGGWVENSGTFTVRGISATNSEY